MKLLSEEHWSHHSIHTLLLEFIVNNSEVNLKVTSVYLCIIAPKHIRAFTLKHMHMAYGWGGTRVFLQSLLWWFLCPWNNQYQMSCGSSLQDVAWPWVNGVCQTNLGEIHGTWSHWFGAAHLLRTPRKTQRAYRFSLSSNISLKQLMCMRKLA